MQQFPLYVVDGIVLKRKNVGEADRVLTIFSKEHGKIYAIAKGVRKIKSRRAPHLEVFTRARIALHRGKKWDIVTEVAPVQGFLHIRKKLSHIAGAYYLVEIIEKLLPEKQEHREVFVLLVNALTKLDNSSDEVNRICDAFSLELLEALGYVSKARILEKHNIHEYIESIVERRLRTPKIFQTYSDELLP